MRKTRFLSLIMALIMVFTIIPMNATVDAKTGYFSFLGDSQEDKSGTFTIFAEIGGKKLTGYSLNVKVGDESVDVSRVKDGYFKMTVDDYTECEFVIESKTGEYRVMSVTKDGSDIILRVEKKFSFDFSVGVSNVEVDGQVAERKNEKENIYEAYFEKEQLSGVTVTFEAKGYHNSLEGVSTKGDAVKVLKPKAINNYVAVGEELSTTEVNKGASFSSLTTDILKVSNKKIIGLKKGYGKVKAVIPNPDNPDNPTVKTYYIYVYEPLALGNIGSPITGGEGTKAVPYNIGQLNWNGELDEKDVLELSDAIGGNWHWDDAVYTYEKVDSVDSFNIKSENNNKKLVRDKGEGQVKVTVSQKCNGEVMISSDYYFNFLGRKANQRDDKFTADKKLTIVKDAKGQKFIMSRQGDSDTKCVRYFSSNKDVAEVATDYPTNPDAGALTIKELSKDGIYITGLRIYGKKYSYEILSYKLTVNKIKESLSFTYPEPDSITTTTSTQKSVGETTSTYAYENVLKGVDPDITCCDIVYSIQRKVGYGYASHWEDAGSTVDFNPETGVINKFNKYGLYKITATRVAHENHEAVSKSYEIEVKRTPQDISNIKLVDYNPYELIAGHKGGFRNTLTGYVWQKGEEPTVEYRLKDSNSRNNEYGYLNDEGYFIPNDDANLENKDGLVSVQVRLRDGDIYEGTDWIDYTIKIGTLKITKDMYVLDGGELKNNKWYNAEKFSVKPIEGYCIAPSTSDRKRNGEWSRGIEYTEGIDETKYFYLKNIESGDTGVFAEEIHYDPKKPYCELEIKNPLNDTDVTIKDDASSSKIKTSYVTELSTIAVRPSDETSGVDKREYYVSTDTSRILSDEELSKITTWTEFNDSYFYVKNFKVKEGIVYFKITDEATNVTYVNTNKLICDTEAPDIRISTKKEKKLYNGDVELTLHAEDAISGIDRLECSVNGDELDVKYTGESDIKVVIPKKYNTNDIKVVARGWDKAGNPKSASVQFGIDTTKPEVKLVSNNNNVINGKYFTDSRTTKITIKDRNFDKDLVVLKLVNKEGAVPTISKWTKINGTEVNGDDTLYVADITFAQDGEYSFEISVKDKAGNNAEKISYDLFVAHSDFVIDQNKPVLKANYDNNSVQNGNFYKDPRTVTFEVDEHNFTNMTTTYEENGKAANIGGWTQTSTDVYKASKTFSEDGEYEWTVSVKDDANQASNTESDSKFIIDRTLPELSVSGVENQHAYKDDMVGFQVASSDKYFDGLEVSLSYIKKTDGEYKVVAIPCEPVSTANGASFSLQNLEDDGVYTLKCVATDKAGNKVEDIRQFSVNRNGSTFGISEYTKKIVDNGYIYEVSENPVIFEVNADPIVKHEVSVNDQPIDPADYEFKSEGGNGKWYQMSYTINKELFAEESEYSIVVNSTDAANTAAYSDVKDLKINFVVDQTDPVLTISGMENGGIYRTDSKELSIMATDDGGKLKTCTVDVFDEISGEKLGEGFDMSGQELLDYLAENDDVIKINVPTGNNIKVVAKATDCSVKEDGTTNASEKTLSDMTVSTNIYDIMRADKPLLYASAGGFGGIIFIIFAVGFLIRRRKAK